METSQARKGRTRCHRRLPSRDKSSGFRPAGKACSSFPLHRSSHLTFHFRSRSFLRRPFCGPNRLGSTIFSQEEDSSRRRQRSRGQRKQGRINRLDSIRPMFAGRENRFFPPLPVKETNAQELKAPTPMSLVELPPIPSRIASTPHSLHFAQTLPHPTGSRFPRISFLCFKVRQTHDRGHFHKAIFPLCGRPRKSITPAQGKQSEDESRSLDDPRNRCPDGSHSALPWAGQDRDKTLRPPSVWGIT